MSSYKTHILIGATGGLVAYHFANKIPALIPHNLTAATETILILGSGVLALWPDIDEPNSFISRRMHWIIPPLLACLVTSAFLHTRNLYLILGGIVISLAIGLILSPLAPHLVKLLAGGHRRLTHSLITFAALALVGEFFCHTGALTIGLPLIALAWGGTLHLIGDIVTPGGVPLFFPLNRQEFHLLPHYVSRLGETLVTIASLFVIFLTLR